MPFHIQNMKMKKQTPGKSFVFLCLILFSGLLFESCTKQMMIDIPNDQPEDNQFTYLALGDSYTIGESVAYPERWPVQLRTYLLNQEVDMQEPRIIAKTGWTTDELKAGIQTADHDPTYDLVSLLIGVNNQYRGRTAEQFRPEFAELLRTSIGFAGGNPTRVFVVSIPDWGATPFANNRDKAKIAKEIDQFNAVCKQEADKAGVRYFDITAISRKAPQDPALIASDGLHPSGKMYAEWVQLIGPEIKKLLKP